MKIKYMFSLLVLCLIVCMLTFIFFKTSRTEVTLINNNSEKVESVKITVCDEVATLNSIEPQNSMKVILKVTRDCHYEVEAVLVSGKKIQGSVGYVTTGADFKDTIKLNESDVELVAP